MTAILSPGKRSNTPDQQQEPQRSRRPPHRLARVQPEHAGHRAVVGVRGRTRVRVHGEVERLAQLPDRVVPVVGVRRVLTPLRRDDHAAPQAFAVRARDLGDGAVDVAEDRRHDQTGAPLRTLTAELRRPPVVRPRAGEHEHGIGGAVDGEAGAERRAHLAGDRVGTREHDLAGHAVGRQLLVALLGVPAAAQPDLVEAVAVLVLAEPLLLELLAPGEDVVVGAEALAPHLLHERVACRRARRRTARGTAGRGTRGRRASRARRGSRPR